MEQAAVPTWSLDHDTVVALLDSVDWFASLTRNVHDAVALSKQLR